MPHLGISRLSLLTIIDVADPRIQLPSAADVLVCGSRTQTAIRPTCTCSRVRTS